jgi:hypothetical protein
MNILWRNNDITIAFLLNIKTRNERSPINSHKQRVTNNISLVILKKY